MKWLKWAGVAVGSVLVTTVALYALSRWLGPSAEQERALALMSGGTAPVIGDVLAQSYDIEAVGRQVRLEFDQGRREAAFDRVCGEVVAQRRSGAEARDLASHLGAGRAVDGLSQLFAELLAQSPADQLLPPSCKDAFAPPQDGELSLCEAFRGEFALMRSVAQPADLSFDPHTSQARMADALAKTCHGPVQRAIVEDRPLPSLQPSPRFGFDCIGNLSGCILTDIALPAYRDYLLRTQEHGARMRLASTVYWLHLQADAGRPLAERLAARPAALHSPGHPVEVVDGGAALRIRSRHPAGEFWQLPLAPPG